MPKNLAILFIPTLLLVSCNHEEDFLQEISLIGQDGQPFNKEVLDDKVVILNLWATWCNPCIKEMPDLEKMQAQLPEDFKLILASDEDMDKVQVFREKRPFDLTFLRMENSLESLGVYSLPTTFIIGKNGQLLEILVGARKWDSPEQINKLKNYLK